MPGHPDRTVACAALRSYAIAPQRVRLAARSAVPGPDGGRLADAFRAGYSECRPWPDVPPDLFESLIAARWLHQLNLTLNTADLSKLDGYVAGHAERARAWLRRPPGA